MRSERARNDRGSETFFSNLLTRVASVLID